MNAILEGLRHLCIAQSRSLLVPVASVNTRVLHRSFTTPTNAALVNTPELDKLYRLVELEVRGNDPAVLKSYAWFATTAAAELGIKVGNSWALRKAKHDRMTLLKSVHIYKKHRVQYEIRTYFRFMQFHHLTGSTADTFLEYVQRNLPEGVAMKVTKAGLEGLPDHITPPCKEELAAT